MSFAALAKKLHDRLGVLVTLTTPGIQAYDPATGSVTTSGSSTTATFKASVSSATKDRSLIEVVEGDLLLTFSSAEFTPTENTTVTFNGKDYRVVSISGLPGIDTVAVYKVQARLKS